MNTQAVNLQSFSSERDGNLAAVLDDLAKAAKTISKTVNRAGIVGLLGSTGEINVQEEDVQKLDLFANNAFINELEKNNAVAAYASEENRGILDYGKSSESAEFLVSLDPLDGSGNIDVNVSIGSIFSIVKRKAKKGKVAEDDFLQQGSRQVCAGYFLYSTSTMLVYATSKEVNGFTLDPDTNNFILTHQNIKIPREGKVYSVNESYSDKWTPEFTQYINQLKRGENIDTHNAKYVGALVADFHRILLYGGVFLYPATQKNPDGKLRLLYESNPMAYVVTRAGGMATNGKTNILDIVPREIHQRTPLFIGSRADIELLSSLMN